MGRKRGQKKLTRKSSGRGGTKRKKKQEAGQRRGGKGLGLLGMLGHPGWGDSRRGCFVSGSTHEAWKESEEGLGCPSRQGMGPLLAHIMLLYIYIF